MNRPIKFRAWDVFYKKFITSDGNGMSMFWAKVGGGLDAKREVPVMQFTGLTDKNGKEIYEGDVIEIGIADDSGDIVDAGIGEVRFIYNGWYVFYSDPRDRSHETPTSFNDIKELEVIGNIYENPELLKV